MHAATNRIAAFRQKIKTTLELEPEHRDVHGTMVTTVRLISLYTAVITTLDSGAKFAAIISFLSTNPGSDLDDRLESLATFLLTLRYVPMRCKF